MEVLPLTTIGIIIVISIIFSVFIKKIRQNEAIGFIIAGFVLGPALLNFLHPKDPLVVGFAELGLFVLLFYLGIELSLKEFLSAGSTIFSLAIIDMILTVAVGAGIMFFLGHTAIFSIIIGIMLFCTSTAIVAKFILDKGLIHNQAAKIALSILIMQDFLGVLLLVFITGISSSGKTIWWMATAALAFAVSAFYAVYQLSVLVEKWMKENGFGHTEITLYAIGIGLIVATLASVLGLSTAIGAYFAGFALSETEYGKRIKKDVEFLRDFFLVFFFVGFGTTIFFDELSNQFVMPTIEEFLSIAGMATFLGIIAMLAHSISMKVFGAKFGLNAEDSTLAAILLSPLGEFLIIIASVTLSSKILPIEEARILSPLAFMLIIVTLLIFSPAYNHRDIHKKLFEKIPSLPKHEDRTNIKPHTPQTIKSLKNIAINSFVILCFATMAFMLYYELPTFGVPIIYSRQITAVLVFLFFASVPAYKIIKSLSQIFKYSLKK